MSTTLPHGIIQINEGNIAWYGDITSNWQLIDGKIGEYDAAIASIPAPANTGTLTINYGGTTIAMFGADDAGDVSANIPAPGDGALTVTQGGSTLGTFTANQATAETIDIPAPGDGTLTIQRNGTTVDTFTANASVDKTINISTTDDTKIPLAGSNQISGDLIPATTDAYDLGGSSYQWNNAYIKSLAINGVACGDILTHNADEFVPRIGGAVMTGGLLARNVDTDRLMIFGGSAWNGSSLRLHGADYSDGLKGAVLLQASDGTNTKSMSMYPSGTWTWDGTACQITSDQRLKQQITEIDDKLLDAWEDVNLVQFKYNDAVDQKKNKARLHTGYVVQQIDEACKSHNVDISAYGLYCHEEYPEETEEIEVEQKDGTKTKETKVIREASEHYSLRYTEVYAVECMYLRRCIARLTARIEELEKGNKGVEK